jgi:hypothetical protein
MHVDQLLHGYNNGHHLIAGSVSLPLKDADRMSYLSDWSGYVNPFNKDTTYITLYPLEESQSYVIAKSWYADEMSRPGCVWTHSLIVNLESLGQKFSFYELMKLFRRPEREGEDFMSYTKTLELKEEIVQAGYKKLDYVDPTRFIFMAAHLLERQKPAVYAIEKESELYIELCIRIIQNMPYGILKELSICSGSSTPRKIGTDFYNLQFVTGKGEILVEPFPENMAKPKADAGFQFWVDAVLTGRSDVAQMIHHFSEDIGNDSMRFLATTNLLRLLDEKVMGIPNTATILDVITHLVNGFEEKESGSLLKRSFLSEQVSKLFCDERTYILTLATIKEWKSLDYKLIGYHSRVNAYRQARKTEDYVGVLVELSKADYLNDEGKTLLSNALEGLNKEEVDVLLNQDWALFKSIVTLNNQALTSDFWLELPHPQFVSLFSIFQRDVPKGFNAWEKLYKRLLTIDTFVDDIILGEFVKHIYGYEEMALGQWNARDEIPINKSILGLCMKQPSMVIMWMDGQASINKEIRNAIKQYIMPDNPIVISMGSPAWKGFVDGEINDCLDANELVYVYVLAFNWRDLFALGYLRSILPKIYEALSHESFSYASWKQIEKFTGSVPFWRSWDNCRKVLLGVIDYCKAMQLSTKEIENFTSNQKLNDELMELWSEG